MEFQVVIRVNNNLFSRDPYSSELGKKIVTHSVKLIDELGFEAFTFKKLAEDIGTTEAGIYRYFSNKHRLLTYLVNWYWTWLGYQITFVTNNLDDPVQKIHKIISLLVLKSDQDYIYDKLDVKKLSEIVNVEGVKSFLTKQVGEDNQARFFKPYKDLCGIIASIMSEINPDYAFPRSLSSTLLEMSHFQKFYMQNLPSLTDFGNQPDEKHVVAFLEDMILRTLKGK